MGCETGLSLKEQNVKAENILEWSDGNMWAEERECNKGLEKIT
jgi:hypothetical protein